MGDRAPRDYAPVFLASRANVPLLRRTGPQSACCFVVPSDVSWVGVGATLPATGGPLLTALGAGLLLAGLGARRVLSRSG